MSSIDKRFYRSVDGIYKIYVIPENLEDNIDSYNLYNPIGEVPDWLDKIDLDYEESSNTLITNLFNTRMHLYSGNVLIYNTRLEELEDIQPNIREFKEHYF